MERKLYTLVLELDSGKINFQHCVQVIDLNDYKRIFKQCEQEES